MSARVNILYNVIKSRVPVMSLQCGRLLDSSILPSLPDFGGAMDCSLREVRVEWSYYPPHGLIFDLHCLKKEV